jgi:ABC-type transport system involved in cytochrome bd biosynthesis fused ATPase/permease subunit
LERSATSLGSRIESGLINAGHKVSDMLESVLDKRMEELNVTIKKESSILSNTLSTTGIEQLKSFKEIYHPEIRLLLFGWLFICFSIFMASLSYSTNFKLFKLIHYFMDFKFILSLVFAVILR